MKRTKYIAILTALFVTSVAGLAAAQQMLGFHDNFLTLDKNRWFVSDGWTNGDHQSCEWRADALSIHDGKLVMTVSDRGGKVRPIGCAEMHINELTSYGLYETRMRTAAGSGLNTAFFTYIGPPYGNPEWDEMDFEFLGKNPTQVEINHTAQGTKVRGKILDLGFDASKDFHDYAIDWTPSGIKWFVDGVKVYETPAGAPLPHNPNHLFLSLWSGAKSEDTWMGPFAYKEPVTAEVEWVKFTPHR